MTPTERVVDALSAKGCNPRQAGPHQWTARCPVVDNHKRGDRNPSLSIGESPTGKALITCHTGCTTPQVAAALGLYMADLFPDDPSRTPPPGPNGTPKAHYDYPDEAGEILYRVVKLVQADGRKTFRAYRPDGLGGWAPGVAGVRRIPYHLPQLVAAVAAGRQIVICEGEKDAETASWLWPDAATTTNPFGAGKWDDAYSEHLRGARDVLIVADDDPAGHLHALEVRASLDRLGIPAAIYLPPTPHNDLSEAVGAGRGVGDLRPFHGHTEAVQAAVDAAVDVVAALCVNWPEFWSLDHSSETWAIEPIVPAGRSVALYAPAKAGKSLTLLSAVVAAVLGRSVWGLPPAEPIRALYLDYEMTPADLRERLEMLGYGPDDDLSGLAYALIPSLPPLDTPEGGAKVLELALAHGAHVVVVDTFGRAAQGDENDADTVRAYYRHTGALLKAHGIATVRTDHSGKDLDKGQRGSSAKADDVDVVWRLDRTQDGVTLRRTHSRVTWVPESVVLEVVEGDDGLWRFTRPAGAESWPAGTKARAELLDRLGVPLDATFAAANEAVKAESVDGKTGMRKSDLLKAMAWRKVKSNPFGTPDHGSHEVGNRHSDGNREPQREPSADTSSDLREPLREPVGTGQQATVPGFRISRYGTGTSPALDADPDDLFA